MQQNTTQNRIGYSQMLLQPSFTVTYRHRSPHGYEDGTGRAYGLPLEEGPLSLEFEAIAANMASNTILLPPSIRFRTTCCMWMIYPLLVWIREKSKSLKIPFQNETPWYTLLPRQLIWYRFSKVIYFASQSLDSSYVKRSKLKVKHFHSLDLFFLPVLKTKGPKHKLIVICQLIEEGYIFRRGLRYLFVLYVQWFLID